MKLTHLRAVGLMVLVTLMWSTAGVVTRHLEQARSFEGTFWRSFFTMLSLLVMLPFFRGRDFFARIQWRSRALRRLWPRGGLLWRRRDRTERTAAFQGQAGDRRRR